MRAARAILALGLCLCAGRAAGEQFDFTRLVQSSSLDRGDLTTAYTLEVSRSLSVITKGPGGGGGGGGLGGQRDYDGVSHRLAAYYGILRWLSVGVDQTLQQRSASEFQYGVLAAETRFRLPALERLGIQPSLFVGPRIRVNARRGHTLVAGTGLERNTGRLKLVVDLGAEAAVTEDNRANSLRYEAGAHYQLTGVLSAALEAWGVLEWPEAGPFQYAHHGGPTLKLRLQRFWAAANVGFGVKDRPNKDFYDATCMVQLGFAL
ncbi:MAG TPA: hypothetical protein VGQ83_01910 [Polyangia bacterium]|jgi:hypothetical protein